MSVNQKVWLPSTIEEAWQISKELSSDDFCFVLGGTWLRTQWEAKLKTIPSHLVSMERIPQLYGIREIEEMSQIVIGAMTPLAMCIESSVLQRGCEPLIRACRKIAAPSIRNQATIGGNILTRIGDTIPALMCLATELWWFNGDEIISEAIESFLMRDPNNDLLVAIVIPVEKEKNSRTFSFYQKIGRRESFVGSVVTIAGKGALTEGGIVQEITLAAGGGAMTPMRLLFAEELVSNQSITNILLKRLHPLIENQFSAVADSFVSGEYKKSLAANLIIAEFYQLGERFMLGGEQHVFGS